MTEPTADVPGAVNETAKAAGTAIDVVREFGGFISKYVANPLEEGMGIFEDKLNCIAWPTVVNSPSSRLTGNMP